MQLHDFYISFIAFISELLGTISGFGSSTFFVPASIYFESYHFVLVLTATLHIFGNISKLILFRKSLNKKLLIGFFIPVVLMTGVGALLSRFVEFETLRIFLGFFIMSLAVLFYFRGAIIKSISISNAKWVLVTSGFLTGLLGTGGALRGLALTSLQLEKNSFVALSSGIDIGGDILRAGIYFYNGYFEWGHWYFIPLLMVAAYLGSYLGKRVLNYLSHEQFEKIVICFVFLSGFSLFF